MKRVFENELESYLKGFKGNNIIINLDGMLRAKIPIENADFNYNMKKGILTVNNTILSFELNISYIYKMQTNEDKSIFEIFIDNDIEVTIEKRV